MKSRLLHLTLLTNILLVTFFSARRLHLVRQLTTIVHEADSLTISNAKLEQNIRTAIETRSRIFENLKLEYPRLKKLSEFVKRNQIRIKGVPERDGEDLEQKIEEIAKSMEINISPDDINRANRIGVKKATIPRAIVVEFTNFKVKTQMLRKSVTALVNTPYTMQDDVTNHLMSFAFTPVENSDFGEGCGYIGSVEKPAMVAQNKKLFGAWLQDPLPSPDKIRDTYIWVLPHFFENSIVEEYANVHELSHRRSRKTFKLPYEWAGTGHVVYNWTLYFVVYNSSKIVRYDFATKTILKEKKLPRAAFGNTAPYQWAGSTDIDLSADETGLYAIYATLDNTLDIVVSKIHPVTLEVLQTWNTNWRKQWSGNAFMMCGVLYVLKKYDERRTSLSYMYDTRTMRYKRVNIPFFNQYEWNTMLEYNSRTKQIYAWDRGYLVTYNITISDEMPNS